MLTNSVRPSELKVEPANSSLSWVAILFWAMSKSSPVRVRARRKLRSPPSSQITRVPRLLVVTLSGKSSTSALGDSKSMCSVCLFVS